MKEQFLIDKLEERKNLLLLRDLPAPNPQAIDFSSNDYLGLSRSEKVQSLVELYSASNRFLKGATGSRLISGNHPYFAPLEDFLAAFHEAAAALVFNSGYNANVGLLSCLAGKGDTYISDALVHASLIDGMRLSYAHRFRFKHNDLADLEAKLKQAQGNVFVVVESVYSMDGDTAPLKEILGIVEKYGAHLIVDEAHGLGVFGDKGEGLCMDLGVHKRIFARIYTYGKALGCHGAAIVGSRALKDYLINFSRSFIYTTALPPEAVITIQCAYEVMEKASKERKHLQLLINHFRKQAKEIDDVQMLNSSSAIQSIIIPSNEAVTAVAEALQAKGIGVKAIRHPTVAVGEERIRICLHSFNIFAEIDKLAYELAIAVKNQHVN